MQVVNKPNIYSISRLQSHPQIRDNINEDWLGGYLTNTGKKRNRLERILTMVYVVQNYLASFGLYPSSGMWKFYKRLQRF
jgi:hypothetical protein